MILTTTQAQAICDAMHALNNVGGQLSKVRAGHAHVVEHAAGHIVVSDERGQIESEVHESPTAFAAAYGLAA